MARRVRITVAGRRVRLRPREGTLARRAETPERGHGPYRAVWHARRPQFKNPERAAR